MQKVKHLKDELKKKNPDIQYKYIVTEKIDGWYVWVEYCPVSGWGSPRSSSGRVIPSLEHYRKAFQTLPKLATKAILIMECWIPDIPFHVLNGILNRKLGDYKATDVIFTCHDLVYLDNKPLSAISRYTNLNKLLRETTLTFPFALSEILIISGNKDVWYDQFHRIVDKGGEGVVLKQLESLYQPEKRNASLMKIKQNLTLDLEIIDFKQSFGGKGNLSYILKTKRKSGVEITVNVGKQRDIDHFKCFKPIGLVAEISAMQELEGGKLREPVFKCIRIDKSVEELVD